MAILYLYDEISFSFRRYHSTCSTQFTIIIHFRVTSFGSIIYVYSMSVAVEFRFGSIGFQTDDIKYFRKYQSTLRFSCFNLTKSALRFKNHSIPFCLLQVQVHYTLGKGSIKIKKNKWENSHLSVGPPSPPSKVGKHFFFIFNIWGLKSNLM